MKQIYTKGKSTKTSIKDKEKAKMWERNFNPFSTTTATKTVKTTLRKAADHTCDTVLKKCVSSKVLIFV